MALGVVAGPAVAASAAPGDLAFGKVVVDSNKNNVIDQGPTGSNDTGVAGVKVILKGSNPDHPGWETTTDAQGRWAFPAGADHSASPGPFTVTVNATGVNGNNYLVPTTPTAGVNDFTRVANQPQQSVSGPIPANGSEVELNSLVYPTWTTDVIPAQDPDGVNGAAIWTGTAPFDPNDAEPGFDSGTANMRVRTSDVINHTWSVTIDAEQDLDSNANVWFEQELKLGQGAIATFGAMPSSCGAGSQIVALPSGTALAPRQNPPAGTTSVVLKCNVGPMGEVKSANLLDTQVFVSADSVNGATFTTEVRTYGATPDGVTTARPDGPSSYGPFEITASPRYDIEKSGGFTYGGYSYREINGEQVLGKYIYYSVQIATDRKVGVEAFQQPVHFEEALWGQYKGTGQNGPDGSVNPGLKWYMTGCSPYNGDGRQKQSTTVYGKIGMPTAGGGQAATAENSVRDSGQCSFSRQDASSDTANYDVTLSGIDASGASYPTKGVNGTALAANKYYVASYEIVVFVPRAEIDKMTGGADDNVGIGAIWNRVGDFDPKGSSGASNYGSGFEAGYCRPGPNTDAKAHCDTMPDGKQSNNVAGPVEIRISPGVWSKEFTDLTQEWGFRAGPIPGSAGAQDGRGQVQPGQTFTSRVKVSPETDSPNPEFCDVFDNTVLKLSPLGKDATLQNQQYGGAATQLVYQAPGKEIATKEMPAYQANFRVKYGHVDLTGDNPNTGVFSAGDNRWSGDWSKQQAAASGAGTACGSPNVTFYDNPGDVPGGIDAVNVVWAKSVPGYVQPASSTVHMLTGLEQRNRYNGGPHAGQEIPANTISANYGNVKSDTLGNWAKNGYYPGAGTTGGVNRPGESGDTTGDRWSLVRAEMSLKKWSVAGTVDGEPATGVAPDGQTGTAKAGSPVIWHLNAVLNASSEPASPVTNVRITDTLPKGVEYDADSTAELGGPVPSSATVNADGTTTLIWELGTLTPNQPIPAIEIATHVDPFLNNNTSLTNTARITADGIVPVANVHTDTHTVTVTQPGSLQLKKSVDQVLDLQNDDQRYTLQVKNFSQTLRLQAPTIIEVLPYNGDATNAANVNRNPASDFAGTNALTAAPKVTQFNGTTPANGTFYYTTVAPANVPQDLNADTDPSIWSTTFTPNATAFKFVAANPLGNASEGASSGLQITFQTKQAGNTAGDRYSDRFTAFSSTLQNGGKYQLLTSNQVMVRVVGFSIGDLIWFDINNDGKFTPGIDRPAPEGVKVQVFDQFGLPVAGGNVTTNKDGRWVVNDLHAGGYYAVIPASEFAAGGPLEGWVAQTAGYQADPNTDKNESVDHNGAAQADGSMKTGVINVSATVNGSTITGNEPMGDNTGNMPVTPGTTDGFTNFTLDMALKATPDYEFTKTADPESGTAVQAGDTITYTLTGENTGMTPLDVVISDDLSEVLKFADLTDGPTATVDGQATDPNATLTGTDLEWAGALQPGQKVTVTYVVTVAEGHEGETISNRANSTATPPYDPPITPPEVVTEHPIPGYDFAKTSDPESGTAVQPGQTITYTLTGTNTGATALDPVVITDDLAQVLNHATITADPVATIDGETTVPQPSVTGTELAWNGSLKVGQQVEITYTVTLNDDAWGVELQNLATSAATPPGLPPITPPPGVTEHPTPAYEFTKTSDPVSGTAVNPGDTITYTVTGSNTGKTELDVVIDDDLSNVLNNAALTSDPVATIEGADSVPAATVDGTAIHWQGKLQPGQSVVITYMVTLNADAVGVIVNNHASSQATPPGLPPINPPDVETKHPTPGYAFTKTSDPESGTAVNPGDTITYTVTGSNTGKTELDVAIADDLSNVLNNATITTDPVATIAGESGVPQPTVDGTTLSWNGVLEVGQQVEITYTVTLNDDAWGVLVNNHASSEATPPGLPPINPPDVETEHPTPGYAFTKTANPASGTAVNPGQTIEYTLTGVNTGMTVLDPVVIHDDLSEVLNHATLTGDPVATIEGEATVPQPTVSGTDIDWEGTLQIGQTVTITYTVTLNEDAEGVIVRNHASSEATPPGLPPITPPDVETWHPTPGYTFNKAADPVSGSAVTEGDVITYTLTGTNAGETALDPVVVNDDLAKVLEFATLESGPTAQIVADGNASTAAVQPVFDGDKLSWNGSLQIGEQVAITYSVKVQPGFEGETLNNHASSSATPPGLPPITPPDVVTEHPIPGFEIAKTSDPASGSKVNPGQNVTYTVTGTNTGATGLDPVVLTDDLSKVLNHTSMVGSPTAVIIGSDGSETAAAAPKVQGTTLTWTGSLEIGEKVQLRYTVKVDADAENVSIRNVVTGSATPPGLSPITPPQAETHHDVPEGLSVTGGAATGGLIGLGALLLAGGTALVLIRRRRQEA